MLNGNPPGVVNLKMWLLFILRRKAKPFISKPICLFRREEQRVFSCMRSALAHKGAKMGPIDGGVGRQGQGIWKGLN